MERLDEVDRRLVTLLLTDGRKSVARLAEEAAISRASAYRRLERLEDEGIIAGYRAVVDPAALGWGLTALIEVSADQGSWRDLRDELLTLPGLEYLAATAGVFDFVLLLRATSMDQLRDTVLERLALMPAIRDTRTTFVLEDARCEPGVPA